MATQKQLKNQDQIDKFLKSKLPEGKNQEERRIFGGIGLSIIKGKKSAKWYYWPSGSAKKRVPLGDAHEITLKKAKESIVEFEDKNSGNSIIHVKGGDYSQVKLGDYLDLVYKEGASKSGKVSWHYRNTRKHIPENLLDKPVMEITKADAVDWFNKKAGSARMQGRWKKGGKIELEDTGETVSDATAKKHIAALRAMISWGVEREHFPYNPLMGIKIKAAQARVGRGMDDFDWGAYLNAIDQIKNKRLKCFLIIAANTGARQNEILTLKLEDLHLSDNNPYAEAIPSRTKSKKKRDLILNEECVAAIKEYMNSEYFKKPNDRVYGEYLFYSPRTGTHVKSMYKTFQKWANGFGEIDDLKRTCLHAFRHTFARKLHEQVDLATVRDVLGHSTIAVTDLYLNSSKDNQREGVLRMMNNNRSMKKEFLEVFPDFGGEDMTKSEELPRKTISQEDLAIDALESEAFFKGKK